MQAGFSQCWQYSDIAHRHVREDAGRRVDLVAALREDRVHQLVSGRLFVILQFTEQALHPTHRFVSMTIRSGPLPHTPFVLLDFAEEVVEGAVRAEIVHVHIRQILRMPLDKLASLETVRNGDDSPLDALGPHAP